MVSCSGDDDNITDVAIDCALWTNQVNDSLDEFFDAQLQYATTPSVTNCINLKNSANAYIDTVEDFFDCIPNNLADDFNQAVADAREAIADLDCD